MVLANDIWEMWNPETGVGYGVKQLGMSTSVVDVMFRLRELPEEEESEQLAETKQSEQS